jgi:hypothetical protein
MLDFVKGVVQPQFAAQPLDSRQRACKPRLVG